MRSGASSQVRRRLSAREKQVLELIGQGLTRPEVGEHLGLVEGTIDGHMKRIFTATGAHCANQALAVAVARGEIVIDVEVGEPLTGRQQQILVCLAQGLSNVQIATRVGRGRRTIANDLTELYRVLKARTRAHLVYLGLQNGNLTINRREKT